MHYIDIIFLLILVVVVFLRLRDVLGKRSEADIQETKISKQAADKIFDIIIKEAEKNEEKPMEKGEVLPVEKNLSEACKALKDIPNFDENRFINSAKRAFEMIVVAFSKGDVDTLENLLTKNLAKKFKEVIDQRKKDCVVAETDFIGFNFAEIDAVKLLKSGMAKVQMKFISEQINILRDKKEKVIEGDENFIQKITDIWTFERNIKSSDPRWLLASTKK